MLHVGFSGGGPKLASRCCLCLGGRVSQTLRATSSGVSQPLRSSCALCALARNPGGVCLCHARKATAGETHARGGCSPHPPERSTGAAPLGGMRQRDDANIPSVRCGRLDPHVTNITSCQCDVAAAHLTNAKGVGERMAAAPAPRRECTSAAPLGVLKQYTKKV
jgi:hypothetical protein